MGLSSSSQTTPPSLAKKRNHVSRKVLRLWLQARRHPRRQDRAGRRCPHLRDPPAGRLRQGQGAPVPHRHLWRRRAPERPPPRRLVRRQRLRDLRPRLPPRRPRLAGGVRLGKHGADVTRPAIDKVVDELRKQGVKKFAAVGFCFGGRYVVDLVLDDAINVGMVAHPSLLKVPEDIQALAKKSTPFLWNHATEDVM